MCNETVRQEVITSINAAVRNSCNGENYSGKEICVYIPVPMEYRSEVGFDNGNTDGIELNDVKIEAAPEDKRKLFGDIPGGAVVYQVTGKII